MRAVIYTRVSTEEQGRKYGPAFQERACREYAARVGMTAVEVIRDEISGRTTLDERPGGRRLMELAQGGQAECIVVWRTDRLHRAPKEERSRMLTTAEQLARWNVELHACDRGEIDVHDTLGVILLMLESSVATDELQRIAERSAAGRREKAKSGKWVGAGGAPYGYRQVWYGNRERLELEIDPEQAAIVRELFQAYGNGVHSLGGLVRWLNDRGVPSPRGDDWHYSTIRLRILSRRVYLGEFEYAGIAINRPDLAIITEEEWQAVQERFETNRQRSRRNKKYDYLLSGHFTCSCGRIMRGYANKGGKHRYYGCRFQVAPNGECDQPRFHAVAVEEAVWDKVYEFLDNPDQIERKLEKLRKRQRAAMLPTEERIKAIDGLLAKTRRRKQAQLKALGVLGEDDDVIASLAQIKEQEQALQRERAALAGKLERGILSPEEGRRIQDSIALIRAQLGQADFEAKRRLFNFLNLAVVVKGEEFKATCNLGEISSFQVDSIPSQRSGDRQSSS